MQIWNSMIYGSRVSGRCHPDHTLLCILCDMRLTYSLCSSLWSCFWWCWVSCKLAICLGVLCNRISSHLNRFLKSANLQGGVKWLGAWICCFLQYCLHFHVNVIGFRVLLPHHIRLHVSGLHSFCPWDGDHRLLPQCITCWVHSRVWWWPPPNCFCNFSCNTSWSNNFVERESSKSPPGAFAMDDLVWTNHITQGQGKRKSSLLAIILWDRLNDFIKGEEQYPQFPCNFTKEIVRVNLPHSLRTPRAHSPAIILRFDLLPPLKLKPCTLFFMFCLS